MRLTERKVCYPQCNNQGNLTKVNYIEIKDKKLAEEKLCQLEDIEDELGIDLITLFKALKNGIVIKDEPLQNYPCSLNHNDIGWFLFVRTDGVLGSYYLKDYGKTWALTKEELENG